MHSYVSPDIVGFLPGPAADKLRMLRQHINDLRSLCPPFEEVHAANTARGECQRRIDQLVAHSSNGGYNLGEDDARVVRERERLAALTKEATRLSDLQTVRQEAWRQASHALANVEAYLRDGKPANVVFEVFEGREPTLGKGEDIPSALERIRRRGRELRADLNRIQTHLLQSPLLITTPLLPMPMVARMASMARCRWHGMARAIRRTCDAAP